MTIWFTSDEHYSHENIIRYCNRPFANADEMNEALIEEHNRVVKDKDIVYHLGDFTFRKLNFAFETISRLNGQHFFIRGNHDYWNQETGKDQVSETDLLWAAKIYFGSDKIIGVKDYLEIKTNDGHFILSHFPMFTWHKNHRGSMMLHGHCHGMIDHINSSMNVKRLDVGVDSAYKYFGVYRPFSMKDVVQILSERGINPPDNPDNFKGIGPKR